MENRTILTDVTVRRAYRSNVRVAKKEQGLDQDHIHEAHGAESIREKAVKKVKYNQNKLQTAGKESL